MAEENNRKQNSSGDPAESFLEQEEEKATRLALLNMLEDTDEARRRAEEEKNKTLLIINNFTDGLLVFDSKNQLSLFNPQAEKFFGLKARNLVGKTLSELEIASALSPILKSFGGELKNIFRQEVPLRDDLVLEMSALKIINNEGGEAGSLVILHDITREKMIEKMKTEFVSLAAHQLRTPLSAIKWTIRMILDGDVGTIGKNQKDMLQKTYLSNERMIGLVNDLLNVTRIEEGRYIFKRVSADIGAIAQFVVDSYQEEAKKRDIKLELVRPNKKLPEIIVDEEKINVAFQNILDNAIKYTPRGGRVTVAVSLNKKEVEISIKDTGLGIPSSQQKRVFTKFFRAANIMGVETEGSGLGLFITKNIVEAHGGKIWFESSEGQGSIFHFSLPINPPTPSRVG